ncbi:MAG: tetratricopeptide repeat protein, partial [Bacteroidota bacterium]
HISIGAIYNKSGVLDSARWYFQEALEKWRRLGEDEQGDTAKAKVKEAMCMNNLAVVLRKQGNLKKALELARESIRLRKEFGKPSEVASSRVNLGNIYLDIGQFDSSRIQYQRVQAFGETDENVSLQIKAMTCLVGLAVAQDSIYQARLIGEKVFALANQSILTDQVELEDMTIILYQLGVVLEESGAIDQAQLYYEESLQLGKGQNVSSEIVALLALAEVHLQKQAWVQSKDAFEKAIQIERIDQQPELQIRALEGLGNLSAAQAQYE